MPIRTFTFPDENIPANIPQDAQDGFLRRRFVQETHAFLHYLVRGDLEGPYSGLPHDQFPFLHRAWNEVAGRFLELDQSVMHIESRTVARHGIGGAQLRFKLGNVARWSQRLGAVDLPTLDEAPMARLPDNWRKYIQYLLDSINNLLNSILKALGAGSAVQEIKDAIKDAIKWLFDE